MALQVWLPLNKEGDFQNRGLANITVTNNGATYNSSGKIGGCYTFGNGSTSSNGVNINNNFTDLGTSRSICAWVNPKGNHLHYSGTIVSSGNWNTSHWGFCLNQDNTGITGFDNYCGSYFTVTIPTNTWTHLCVTVVDNVTKFYKNGEYLGESSRGTAFTSDANNTMIGRETYASGYFSFNGDISDVRIYDHCLSPKEVKEISKALVLHYPLNDTYITQSTTVYDCSGYSNNGTVIGSLSCVEDSPRYNVSTYFSANTTHITLPSINYSGFGNSYTFSWWAKGNPQMMWGFADGNRLNIPFAGCYANTGDSYNNPFYTPGTTTTITSPLSTTEFKYYVAVGDGSTLKLYVNGVHYGTAKTYKALTGTQIYINGWSSSSSYAGVEYVSDFRIYATALSADDIKELYNTSAIACNNGVMLAYELEE